MKLPEISVRRPVTVLMMVFIVLILGGVSFSRLPIDLLPEIKVPVAIISTTYKGVGPQEIEKIVTQPLEEAVGTVQNIDKVTSVSSEGSSLVIAQFNFGTDMDFAALEMREKVDLVKKFLPSDADAPMVMKFDPNAQPIIQMTLSSKDSDLAKLQTIADEVVKPRLERVAGVASVSVTGGYKNQVQIRLSQEKMRGYGLSSDYIAKIIGAENLNSPGGTVQKGNQELTIRTLGEFQTLDDIKGLLIPLPAGGTVHLSELAEVELKHEDLTTIGKTNGNLAVLIAIQKQSGTNTVQVAAAVNKEVETLKSEIAPTKIDMVMDQSVYINKSIKDVYNNALMGAVLAVLVLFLFLRNLRTTLIIGTSIPISIIFTFMLMYFAGITINLMTLGGLALGVGMLVDNAIVALENIYRFRQEGNSRLEAAIKGASEVGMALTASTLTTVAVFLPIVFVQGITATIFRQLALTVTMSLAASLVVALTLVPMLSSKILKVDRDNGGSKTGLRKIFSYPFDLFDRFFRKVESGYGRLLRWALGHRKSTVLIAILVFVLSMTSVVNVGAEFFPKMDEGQFTVNVTLPEGAELKDTEQVMNRIEGKLQEFPEMDAAFSIIGTNGMYSFGGEPANKGMIYARLKELKERTRSVEQVEDELRGFVKDIAGAEIEVQTLQTFSMGEGGAPISISIKGDDLGTLKRIGEDLKKLVESVPGTREVKANVSEGLPEAQVKIDRKNASQYGLTAAQIAGVVKGTISGTTATRYKYNGTEIDVVIQGDELFQESISNLEQTPIQTPAGMIIPLSQVAQVTIERGPAQINREGKSRVISVSAQFVDRDLGSISKDIEGKLKAYPMPEGYTYEMGGENKELNDAFKDLSLALVLAVILVYMILASQFESLLHPVTIMMSVPLGFSGGMLGLFIARKALSVPAFIGMIMLAGIVVNNAIVLVDYINTRRKRGEERSEAIVNAGPIRLRPILMTTLTTVLGLIPLSLGIGDGAEAQQPMAVAVIGGLSLSTLLTLVVVPVVYTLFDDLTAFLKRKVFKTRNFNLSA
ncbi:efflux RND transporter permease subunit [Paradesulfitobacterium ferrireducens]|uniref:efflux RND transporter permease subunit n=1 Tax=Paradesulfitobacterium ferrireducens TaxID=2816476 RepID=UPI001A8C3232|nr:efflux RND transporter permease subunit [Paradesulfitobacterium ferrireducens]